MIMGFMPRKELNLVNLSLDDHAQVVLNFFKDNSDFLNILRMSNLVPNWSMKLFVHAPKVYLKIKRWYLEFFVKVISWVFRS